MPSGRVIATPMREGAAPEAPEARAARPRLAPAGLLLIVPLSLALLAYWRSIDGELQFDDSRTITGNLAIRDLSSFLRLHLLGDFWNGGRPVTDLTFALNYLGYGLQPRAYHLTSVALHLVAVVLVFFFTKQILARVGWPRPERLSLAVAGIFALHPLQSQAVSYISQRSEVLASLGYVAALLLVFAAEKRGLASLRGASAYSASLVVFVLALGAKAIAVTLPAAYLLCSWALPLPAPPTGSGPPRVTLRTRLAMASPLAAISVVFAARQLASVRGNVDVGFGVVGLDPWHYFLTQLRVVLTYLRLLAWPSGLNLDRVYPTSDGLLEPRTLFSALALAVLLLTAVVLLRWARGKAPGSLEAASARLGAVGLFWFLLILTPTSSVVPMFDVIEEHRVYLASWGILLAVGAAAGAITERLARRGVGVRRTLAATTLALWAVLAFALHDRNAVWATPESLWRDVVAKSPTKSRAHANLAYELHLRGDPAAALAEYRKALPLVSDRSISRLEIVRNMTASLFELGRIDEARALLQEALSTFPGHPELLNNLAITYLSKKDFETAARLARLSLEGAPSFARAHITLGQALLGMGDLMGALTEFTTGTRLEPEAAPPLFNLATVQERLGMTREACDSFRRVARLATGRLLARAADRVARCDGR